MDTIKAADGCMVNGDAGGTAGTGGANDEGAQWRASGAKGNGLDFCMFKYVFVFFISEI